MTLFHGTRTLTVAAVIAGSALFGAFAASAETHGDMWVVVNNHSSEFVSEIYVSPTEETETWGPNLIGESELGPGEFTEVVPAIDFGGCHFDVLLVFDDGYEMTLPEVDLCEFTNIATDGYEYITYSI
jgi:hypothetical protein